jgi:UDP:flavonoid glycosyltransferase YjiC (YdhE family)
MVGFVGGYGHFEPIVPLARALRRHGHEVHVSAKPAMRAAVLAHGFGFVPTGDDVGSSMTDRLPLQPYDGAREELVLVFGFADRLARNRAAGMLRLIDELRPDLVVCDEVDFGSIFAAEQRGVPVVVVGVLAAGGFLRAELVAEPLARLRSDLGLLPTPDADALPSGARFLAPMPPSVRDPAFGWPANTVNTRPAVIDPDAPSATAPRWLEAIEGSPLVHIGLGTEFNREAGDLFARAIEGVRDVSAAVVVTVGPGVDPAELGPQPAQVSVVQTVPYSVLLPRCDLVVTNGGSGTVVAALAHGVPLAVLPMGADHMHNARRVADLGVAAVLDAVRSDAGAIEAAVRRLLDDRAGRARAASIAAECAALPAVADLIPAIESLARC